MIARARTPDVRARDASMAIFPYVAVRRSSFRSALRRAAKLRHYATMRDRARFAREHASAITCGSLLAVTAKTVRARMVNVK